MDLFVQIVRVYGGAVCPSKKDTIPIISRNQKVIESSWSNTFGDRNNEIVFIGQDMDQEQRFDLKMSLDSRGVGSGYWKMAMMTSGQLNELMLYN